MTYTTSYDIDSDVTRSETKPRYRKIYYRGRYYSVQMFASRGWVGKTYEAVTTWRHVHTYVGMDWLHGFGSRYTADAPATHYHRRQEFIPPVHVKPVPDSITYDGIEYTRSPF